MKIALMGYGVVNMGVYKILQEEKKRAAFHLKEPVEVKKIVVRNVNRERKIPAPKELFTADAEEVFSDPSIDLVVEATSSKDQSVEYIRRALTSGKDVVTSNKAAVASAYDELAQLAEENGRILLFEAAVCGGIPLLDPLRRRLAFNDIPEIRGIVNGSSNYVLTELSKGRDLDLVMKEAREKGVLEEDPTDDLCGFDARRKLVILADLILAGGVKESQIPCIGVDKIQAEDLEELSKEGKTVKLIAHFKKEGEGEFLGSVLPTALPSDSQLAQTGDVWNMVYMYCSRAGELRFFGAGGGMDPTADAILTDIYTADKAGNPMPLPIVPGKRENLAASKEGSFYIRRPAEKGTKERMTVNEAVKAYNDGASVILLEA